MLVLQGKMRFKFFDLYTEDRRGFPAALYLYHCCGVGWVSSETKAAKYKTHNKNTPTWAERRMRLAVLQSWGWWYGDEPRWQNPPCQSRKQKRVEGLYPQAGNPSHEMAITQRSCMENPVAEELSWLQSRGRAKRSTRLVYQHTHQGEKVKRNKRHAREKWASG